MKRYMIQVKSKRGSENPGQKQGGAPTITTAQFIVLTMARYESIQLPVDVGNATGAGHRGKNTHDLKCIDSLTWLKR